MKDLSAARRYSSSLLELAIEKNEVSETAEWLKALKQALKELPQLRAFLYSFRFETDNKVEVLGKVFENDFSDLLSNFMRTIINNKRQDLIPDISDQFNKMAMNSMNKILVSTFTPEKLSEDTGKMIKEKLDDLLGKDVVIESIIDPSLIGGMILRIDNSVIDGSVRGYLTRLRKDLLI